MLFVLFKLYRFTEVIYYTVDSHSGIAAFACRFDFLFKLALFSPCNRRKNLYLCAFGQRHNLVNNLVYRLLLYLSAAFRAMRNTYSRI